MFSLVRTWISDIRLTGWSAWTTSLCAHGVVLGIAALLVVPRNPNTTNIAIDTTWNPPETVSAEPFLVPRDVIPKNLTLSPDAGGSSSGDFDPTQFIAGSAASLSRHLVDAKVSSLGLSTTGTAVGLNRGVTPLPTNRNTGGIGNGTGTGVGNGNGPGFFGMAPPAGQRTVFVVDSSRSMNHPHDSPSKTRFRRLKLELLKCITEMKPEDSFFVIFFSNEANVMPARSFQPSIPGPRDRFLQWIGTAESGGSPTNPIPALDIALRMQPDVIVFLTDGEFEVIANRRLKSLKQANIVIHTFAFGETFGEEVLKAMADNNRGEYRFIP